MEGQEYLDQISANNRVVKKSGMSKIFSSKFFIVGMVGLVALVIILVLGMVLNGNKTSEKELCYKLRLHIDNTASIINDYKANLKSSDLRSSSVSLSSVLSVTANDLNSYLVSKYKFKEKDINKNLVTEATTKKDALYNELFNAKINGFLDRTFAHKMVYEIALLRSEEAKIINTTSSQELKDNLTTSYNSLENIYNEFNNFSEAN